ncbi:SDR family NAD(P)-dependent oxidoreductase, partial [Mesorhizobium sp. M00.F.Ca.ET.149.01.1.1]
MNDFDGKVALVTGTTGIAEATARRLAEGGAAIIALGIDQAANAMLQAELTRAGAAALVLATDVAVPDQVEKAIAAGVAKFGGLDIIVNSAAVHPYGTATTTDFETWNRTMSVNVGSIYLTARFGIPE